MPQIIESKDLYRITKDNKCEGKTKNGANPGRRAEQPKAQVVVFGALFWFIFWASKK